MSHAPKNIHWRLESACSAPTYEDTLQGIIPASQITVGPRDHAVSYDCASGCTATAICPPGRCVKAGGRVSDAPRGRREGGEAFTLSAPLVPLRVEVLGVQLRPRCTAEGPKADGAFVCDCRPGECPGMPEIPAAAVPPGWKLVPVDPTEAMVDATHHGQPVDDIYRDMLAAAPIPPAALLPAEREALKLAREALQAVTFTDRTAIGEDMRASVPYHTLMRCANAIAAIDAAMAQQAKG